VTDRTCKGKVRTGLDVVKAIPNIEAFLVELATLKDGEFWELNEAGQLVMGDGCTEPARDTFGPDGEGLDYDQSRSRATRVCTLNEAGQPVVIEGDDTQIPLGVNVISGRGLATLQEYKRKNTGQFEPEKFYGVQQFTWIEIGKNPSYTLYACSKIEYSFIHSDRFLPGYKGHLLGSRRVLRVNLNFDS